MMARPEPTENRMAAALPELVTLRTLVQSAGLVADAKHTALWCLDQLPKLYADFCGTHESRFAGAILRLARAILKRLAEEDSGEDAGRVGDALVAQLGGLHERLGLTTLALRPVPATGRKKSA
jgi:hypothetical protein